MKDTEKSFLESSAASGGRAYRSIGPQDIVEKINLAIRDELTSAAPPRNLELVVCLDTTASMRNDIEAIKKELIYKSKSLMGSFDTVIVGMVLYRDYGEVYVTKIIPWTSDVNVLQKTLNGIRAVGGRDIPEAVDEALFDAATRFVWSKDAVKLILLIGDAPPHPVPVGKITREAALDAAASRSIKISTIMLPQ